MVVEGVYIDRFREFSIDIVMLHNEFTLKGERERERERERKREKNKDVLDHWFEEKVSGMGSKIVRHLMVNSIQERHFLRHSHSMNEIKQ